MGTRGEPPSGSGALEGLYDLATELTRAPRADLLPRRASLRSRLPPRRSRRHGARPTTCPASRSEPRGAARAPACGLCLALLLRRVQKCLDRGWNPTRRSETRPRTRGLRKSERQTLITIDYEKRNSRFPLADAQRVLHRATEVAISDTTRTVAYKFLLADTPRAARRRWPPPKTRCAVGGRVPPPPTFPPFPVRTTTPVSSRLRPRKVAPLARRSRATSNSGVAIAIDDANGSFFGARAVARAFASRPRSVARGGERVFLRTLEPLDRVAERGHVF